MKAVKKYLFFIFLIVSTLLVTSCKKDSSSPIVLPPGTEVTYSTNDYVGLSQAYYKVELQQYNSLDKTFNTLSDITPKVNLDLGQNVSYVLPKDKNTAGIFLIKVNLSRQPLNFEAFVVPGRTTFPSMATTLAVELIKKYSNKSIDTYREDTVIAIENFIKEYILTQNNKYTEIKDQTLEVQYKFMKNGLSSNYDFLSLLKDYEINFSFNDNGIVSSAPFPFSFKNNFPSLDMSNSTPVSKIYYGIEKQEVLIRGQGIDLDNDFLIYRWSLEGAPMKTLEKTEFRWTPDYDGFRATPYVVSLVITDGSKEQALKWNVQIANFNRLPKVSSDCPKEIKENQTVKCKISAVDFDSEATNISLRDTGVNSRATINSLKTDDSTRVIKINNTTSVDFEFTPNNKDALARSAYFQFEVEDAGGGTSNFPLAFSIEDINSPPDIVGTYTEITPDKDHEWDYCALENPDGGLIPFDFSIKVQDPDNITATADGGFDIISTPRLGGSLSCSGDGCVEAITCPAGIISTPQEQYFCYRWKASESKKTGTLSFTFKDDHGGTSELRQISLVASDRNEKPCVRDIPGAYGRSLSLNQNQYDYTLNADDFDLDVPFVSITSNQSSNSSDVYPFLYDSNTSKPLIFRKKYFGNTLNKAHYRTRFTDLNTPGGAKVNLRVNYQSPYSGVVKFYRSTTFSSDVTIPQDFPIETNAGLLPTLHYKYKTAQTVTMEKDDLEVWVPVTVYDQTIAVNKLNSIKPTTIDGISVTTAGLSVTNSSPITDFGTITISRVSTATSLSLPKYMEFFSSDESIPSNSTMHFYNFSKVDFAVGQSSATVSVSAFKNHLTHSFSSSNTLSVNKNFIPYIDFGITSAVGTPQNEMILGSTLSDNSIKVSYENLYNYTNFSLNPINGSANRSLTVTAEDSFTLSQNSILKDQNGDQYKLVGTDLTLFGTRQLQRLGSATNPLSTAITLTAASTIFNSLNNTKYVLDQDINFPANTTTVNANLKRTNHTNPLTNKDGLSVGIISFDFFDKNFKPIFISPVGALNLTVNEGDRINDFLMEVNDNESNPGFPNDPYDRHSFTITPQGGTTPNGQLLFCREKGDSLVSISSPSCTPCNTPISTDYWDSARCYIRFFPSITHNTSTDIDQSYTYVVTAQDNSPLNFGEAHDNQQILTIKVTETNDAPYFTDSSWNTISSSQVSPYVCGGTSCGDFVEKTTLEFPVYAMDTDKNLNNKSLTFSLEPQVYDLTTSQWVTRPSGITIITDAPISINAFGGNWGSKYRARIAWTPNDQEAKSLAGTGFIIKVKVTDAATSPSSPLSAYAFYKVTVKNINNPPKLKTAVSLTVTTDQYFKNTSAIVLTDSDFNSLAAPINFTTSLSLCKSDTTFNCAAPLDGWPDELKTYDPLYIRNSSVTQCRSGANLNATLALPYLTRLTSSFNSATKEIQYPYQFEWCSQRGHIGNYNVYLQLNDNGDKDRNNQSSPKQQLISPLSLNVVAPIFFKSPKKNDSNVVVNAPNQAFIGKQFTYQTLILNSKKGNVKFELLTYPSGMTLDNNQLVKNDTNSAIGVGLKWTPTAEQLSTANTATWHTVRLAVTDTTNANESDSVTFQIQVKDPLNPVQSKPTLTKNPNLAVVTVDEKTHNTFSVLATDSNTSDRLFYSWFVDNIKKYDEGSSFDYFPGINDFGPHTIRVDVTDGYYTETTSWTVNVRNTVPNIVDASVPDFNLATFNSSKLGKTITNLIWATEAKVETKSGSDTFNSILFSGSYTKSGTNNEFVYNLKLKNGSINPALASGSTGNPLLAESLPWNAGQKTKRISYKLGGGTAFNILLTPLEDRAGSFTTGLTNAVCLPQALTITTSGFNPSHICSNSSDAGLIYKNEDSYGNLVSAIYKFGGISYDISTTKDYRTIQWTNSGLPTVFFDATSITSCGFAGCGNGLRFAGLAVSSKYHRIYASVRDVANSINKLLVFDSYPITTGSNPTLLATLNISDGIDPDNKASDLVLVNDTVNGTSIDQLYILLPGTGGLAILPDRTITPVVTDITFIGNTGSIGKSPTDGANSGRRLVYNTTSKLLYGLSKDSNQVFSVNVYNNTFQVQPLTVSGGLDSIISFNNDQSVYGVSRTLGQIFKLK